MYIDSIISPKSLVSKTLLTNYYKALDADYIKNDIIRTQIINNEVLFSALRLEFFQKVKSQFGSLKCQICNNTDLVETILHKRKIPHNLATIEHVIPLSKGGLKYVEANFICTCIKCNNKRGDKPLFHIGNGMYIY